MACGDSNSDTPGPGPSPGPGPDPGPDPGPGPDPTPPPRQVISMRILNQPENMSHVGLVPDLGGIRVEVTYSSGDTELVTDPSEFYTNPMVLTHNYRTVIVGSLAIHNSMGLSLQLFHRSNALVGRELQLPLVRPINAPAIYYDSSSSYWAHRHVGESSIQLNVRHPGPVGIVPNDYGASWASTGVTAAQTTAYNNRVNIYGLSPAPEVRGGRVDWTGSLTKQEYFEGFDQTIDFEGVEMEVFYPAWDLRNVRYQVRQSPVATVALTTPLDPRSGIDFTAYRLPHTDFPPRFKIRHEERRISVELGDAYIRPENPPGEFLEGSDTSLAANYPYFTYDLNYGTGVAGFTGQNVSFPHNATAAGWGVYGITRANTIYGLGSRAGVNVRIPGGAVPNSPKHANIAGQTGFPVDAVGLYAIGDDFDVLLPVNTFRRVVSISDNNPNMGTFYQWTPNPGDGWDREAFAKGLVLTAHYANTSETRAITEEVFFRAKAVNRAGEVGTGLSLSVRDVEERSLRLWFYGQDAAFQVIDNVPYVDQAFTNQVSIPINIIEFGGDIEFRRRTTMPDVPIIWQGVQAGGAGTGQGNFPVQLVDAIRQNYELVALYDDGNVINLDDIIWDRQAGAVRAGISSRFRAGNINNAGFVNATNENEDVTVEFWTPLVSVINVGQTVPARPAAGQPDTNINVGRAYYNADGSASAAFHHNHPETNRRVRNIDWRGIMLAFTGRDGGSVQTLTDALHPFANVQVEVPEDITVLPYVGPRP